jgi:hypothetical protein
VSARHPVVRPARIALRALGAAALGIALAAVAEFVFFVGNAAWLNLIVWAVLGLALGALSRRWSTAIWVDAVVGFALVFSYSVMGYQGNAPLLDALAPFALIALVGAIGMAVAGVVGCAIRRLVSRRTRPATPAPSSPPAARRAPPG